MAAKVQGHSFGFTRFCLQWWLVLAGIVASSHLLADHLKPNSSTGPVRFVTGDYQDLYASESYQRLDCIMTKVDRDFNVKKQSWRRARQELAQERFDGIYPVMQWASQPYGDFSSPIYLERWQFYWIAGSSRDKALNADKKLGVIAGSLQEVWLRGLGHTNVMVGNDTEHLLKLLKSKRVDELLLSEPEMDDVASNSLVNLSLMSSFYRYVPVSVAFNRQFLRDNVDFMAAFNKHISSCYESRFALDAKAQSQLHEFFSEHFNRWKTVPNIVQDLREQSVFYKGLSEAQLNAIKEKWRADYEQANYAEQKIRTHTELSARLRRARENSQGLLNAVWMLDAQGKLFASSDYFAALDYSDSILFKQVKELNEEEYFIGEVMYSPTFMRSQVIAGIPMRDVKTNRLLGVMAFAIDVERGLNNFLQ